MSTLVAQEVEEANETGAARVVARRAAKTGIFESIFAKGLDHVGRSCLVELKIEEVCR